MPSTQLHLGFYYEGLLSKLPKNQVRAIFLKLLFTPTLFIKAYIAFLDYYKKEKFLDVFTTEYMTGLYNFLHEALLLYESEIVMPDDIANRHWSEWVKRYSGLFTFVLDFIFLGQLRSEDKMRFLLDTKKACWLEITLLKLKFYIKDVFSKVDVRGCSKEILFSYLFFFVVETRMKCEFNYNYHNTFFLYIVKN